MIDIFKTIESNQNQTLLEQQLIKIKLQPSKQENNQAC